MPRSPRNLRSPQDSRSTRGSRGSQRRYFRVERDGRLTRVEDVEGEKDAGGGRQSNRLQNNSPPSEGWREAPGWLGVEELGAMTGFDAKSATPQQKEAWVYQTFERISEQYDLMNDLESFGLHRAWKQVLVRSVAAQWQGGAPFRVLDVASGTGDIALALVRTLPQAQVTAFDFSKNMLNVARRRAEKSLGVGANLGFVQGNAMEMPFEDGSFDAVTLSFGLRNMPDYQRVIEEVVRVLVAGGGFFCLEASYPTAPVIKPAFRMYFKHLMPRMANLVTHKPAEYRWLNDSTEAFLSKPQLAALMRQSGLAEVRYRSFALGAAALHTGIKPK